MRRFFVWSALAALIGILLAGGGYWAYWNYYARFQPVSINRHQAEIQQILDSASWLSAGGGGEPLYIIGYRDSPAMQRYEREEAPKLRAAGVEARIIVFARPEREGLAQSTPAERATVAELWISRDWPLYQRWTAAPSAEWRAEGVAAADGDIARTGVIEAGREAVRELSRLLGRSGLHTRYPLILWRDREGYLKACACADARSWAFIRDDLGAPERVDRGEGPAPRPGEPALDDDAFPGPPEGGAAAPGPFGGQEPETPPQPGPQTGSGSAPASGPTYPQLPPPDGAQTPRATTPGVNTPAPRPDAATPQAGRRTQGQGAGQTGARNGSPAGRPTGAQTGRQTPARQSQTRQTPARQTPARPPQPTTPPRAKKDEEAVFY